MTKTTEDLSGLGMAGKLTVDELNKRRARQAALQVPEEKEALEELNRFNNHIDGLIAEELSRMRMLRFGIGALLGGIIGFLFGYFI